MIRTPHPALRALAPLFAILVLVARPAHGSDDDPRAAYDVLAYRLDVALDPDERRLRGVVAVEARVLRDGLDQVVLDLVSGLEVEGVALLERSFDGQTRLAGPPLAFEHEDDRLTCRLPAPRGQRDLVRVAVTYAGRPRAQDSFTGFHWRETADGRPWVATSFQMIGAHHWFPCKASFFHPEDKPARVLVNLDVPAGLVGVANGRLAGRTARDDREVYHWVHDYPLGTYSIALNAAPYVTIEEPLYVPGLLDPIPFVAYVLPENEAKARLQFRDVPRMVKVFSTAFGPFPFPRSKFGLVETPFWGMEHSSVIAYGSSYPAWCQANDERDPYASRNAFFDYILVHESAHEWWGNAVSSATWGDFWIQEGFATYAEGVYVELTEDRATADRYFETQKHGIGERSRLYRGDDLASAQQAYAAVIYSKGAWVLNTLRHYVDDDKRWWAALRTFFENHRYENASTDDFRRVVERATGEDWSGFFDAWVYGAGYPRVTGTVAAEGSVVRVRVTNEGSAATEFRVPLDLEWYEGRRRVRERLWLEPGATERDLEREHEVTGLSVRNLHRVLGRHAVTVR